MSKQFVKGNKYVFVAKKWRKDTGLTREIWKSHKSWVNGINGREVNNIFSKTNAMCDRYSVSPEWCKCIGRKKI